VVPRAVVIKAITLLVTPQFVTTAAAKLGTHQTAWEHASKMLFIQIGLAILTATMVHTFLQIMDMAALLALRFILIVPNSNVMAVTAQIVAVAVIQQVHAVSVLIVSC
jgi:hypothetical protein